MTVSGSKVAIAGAVIHNAFSESSKATPVKLMCIILPCRFDIFVQFVAYNVYAVSIA